MMQMYTDARAFFGQGGPHRMVLTLPPVVHQANASSDPSCFFLSEHLKIAEPPSTVELYSASTVNLESFLFLLFWEEFHASVWRVGIAKFLFRVNISACCLEIGVSR